MASEHVLIIGSPGVAKSAAVRHIAKAIGGKYFEYILGRFMEPSELFGPVDLNKLKLGRLETQTAEMLPESEIAFLDEIFLGSTAILNTLLGVLNERIYRRGHTNISCPLRICVGASNAMPQEEELAAFADRFLLHVFVDRVPDSILEALLEEGWSLKEDVPVLDNGLAKLDLLSNVAANMDLSDIRSQLAHCIRLLRANNIEFSDRRIVKSQKVISAAAALAGREKATIADLWPLIFVIPTKEGQTLARTVLKDELEQAENATLPASAEAASLSPESRKARLLEQAVAAITEPEVHDTLYLQAIVREIDANFSPETLPSELQQKRTILAGMIEAAEE
ncbi:MAG: AAA family ATPase [Flavobacteriales bacterium]|nr:AAA family ATPase [Flavobacteriales bacterium]